MTTKQTQSRLLSKPAAKSQKQGTSERSTGVYTPVHEDASAETTQHLPLTAEFRKKSIEELLDAEISSMGYEFVGCMLTQFGRGTLLRVYIDKPGGVTVDDCTKVTHFVNNLLDVEDPIKGHYTLEISSPGLERPLFKPMHYQKVIGEKIKLKLHAPHDGRRNFSGVLQAADAENITLLIDDKVIELPYHDILHATTMWNF